MKRKESCQSVTIPTKKVKTCTNLSLPESRISATYSKVFHDGLFSDLVLLHKPSGKEVKAHKFILCFRSEFFKTIIGSKMIESKTSVIEFEEDLPFDIFTKVVEYIYSSRIELTVENVLFVYVLADQLMLESLVGMCEEYFSSLVNEDTVFQYLRTANTMNSEKLSSIVHKYISTRYHLFEKDEFCNLDQLDLLSICKKMAE